MLAAAPKAPDITEPDMFDWFWAPEVFLPPSFNWDTFLATGGCWAYGAPWGGFFAAAAFGYAGAAMGFAGAPT